MAVGNMSKTGMTTLFHLQKEILAKQAKQNQIFSIKQHINIMT
jgi:hypothetical protein